MYDVATSMVHQAAELHAGQDCWNAHTSRLGSGMEMMRSNRPGRVSALSSAAGRLVAAMTTTPVLSSKPSISAEVGYHLIH